MRDCPGRGPSRARRISCTESGVWRKENITGNVSYDPENHQAMVDLRAEKIARIANELPDQEVEGEESGDLLVISWGGTYGACLSGVRQAQAEGFSVSHAHLRYLNPLPKNLGKLMNNFQHILVPELNMGQLSALLRIKYLVPTQGLNKVEGKPFVIGEIVEKIRSILS